MVHVTFEDVLLGEPTLVQLDVDESSRLFPYRLRQQLHDIKRIPPHRQLRELYISILHLVPTMRLSPYFDSICVI